MQSLELMNLDSARANLAGKRTNQAVFGIMVLMTIRMNSGLQMAVACCAACSEARLSFCLLIMFFHFFSLWQILGDEFRTMKVVLLWSGGVRWMIKWMFGAFGWDFPP